jgi:hypothetical protein|tara:strand:+ start:855 stop:1076 length:222 start_codon:yes stop_codon:yes gene_type:complete
LLNGLHVCQDQLFAVWAELDVALKTGKVLDFGIERMVVFVAANFILLKESGRVDQFEVLLEARVLVFVKVFPF